MPLLKAENSPGAGMALQIPPNDGLRAKIPAIGMASILVGLMVRPASLNAFTTEISEPLRALMLAVGLACAVYMSIVHKISKITYLSMTLFCFIFAYIHILGAENISILPDTSIIWTALAIVLLSILMMSFTGGDGKEFLTAKYIIFLSTTWSILLYISGGIELGFPLKFIFEIYSVEGYQFDYTQGVTSLYGTTSICTAILIKNGKSKIFSFLYIILLLLFFSLCLAGGSRGEIMFASAMIFFILKPQGKIYNLIFIIFAFIISISLVQYIIVSDTDIVFLNRLREFVSGSSYGMRDVLYQQSTSLLKSDIVCLSIGCGALYFQSYYNLNYDLYPHNILAEYAISAGGLVTVLVFVSFVYGMIKIPHRSEVFYIGIYSFLIAMKSGDIYGSWIATAFLFFVATFGLMQAYAGGARSQQV